VLRRSARDLIERVLILTFATVSLKMWNFCVNKNRKQKQQSEKEQEEEARE
jgi:hypothetical protein